MKITYEACERYVRGEATLAEARAVRAWLADPANAPQAQEWMSRYAAAPAPATGPDPFNYAAMRENLHARLGVERAPQVLPLRAAPRTWRRWAAAAALAGTVATGAWLYLEQHLPVSVATFTAHTAYGQTRTLTLSDGSRVKLNGHSSLRYPAYWRPGQPREVWLQGEGYFAIEHTTDNQRFLVHTDAGVQVEVLGTRFVVARRGGQTRVVLLQGKVRVEFDDRQQPDVLMQPGELVETQDATTPGAAPLLMAHQRVHTAPYAAWKDAQLVLDETTIAELATRLHDTYGLEVVVASPDLNSRRVTGTVPVGELDVLLQALQETSHLHITRQGNRLTLTD